MTDARRIIVIGAGHNGLTCAAYLARAGRDVTVVEAANRLGGAATTREMAPGFRVSPCAQFLYQLQPEVVRELELERHGLTMSAKSLATVALARDGQHLRLQAERLKGGSERDAMRLLEFHRLTTRFGAYLRRLFNQRPPELTARRREDKLAFASLALSLRRMGRDDMRDFLRVIGINIYDLLEEYFEDPRLKGALALDAVLGTHFGPRSPNTVLTYLHRSCGGHLEGGGVALPAGGMGNVAAALAGAASEAGARLRTHAPVVKILTDGPRAAGVELADGETLEADIVVSSADPKTTVQELLGAQHVETGFARRIDNLRVRGSASRLHLALDALPGFTGLTPDHLGDRLLIAEDPDYVERAFNPAKYGEWSPEPVMEIVVPTVHDPSLAPDGKHVLSATVQYTPYALEGGWTGEARQRCLDNAIDCLARYAPDIREKILHSELLTPADIESEFRMHGGHWHHGELALDQFLFVRPVVGASQYALPLAGLFLCGAGAHPGGGVAGWAGRNAAMTILRTERKS